METIDEVPTTEVVCAGGYVLSLYSKWTVQYGDIDLYTTLPEFLNKFSHLRSQDFEYDNFAKTVRIGMKQWIYLPGVDFDPVKIINTFDITVCQMAIYKGRLYMTEEAKEDFDRREFHVIKSNVVWPYGTRRRVKKYRERGFVYAGTSFTLDDMVGNFPLEEFQLEDKIRWSVKWTPSAKTLGWSWRQGI